MEHRKDKTIHKSLHFICPEGGLLSLGKRACQVAYIYPFTLILVFSSSLFSLKFLNCSWPFPKLDGLKIEGGSFGNGAETGLEGMLQYYLVGTLYVCTMGGYAHTYICTYIHVTRTFLRPTLRFANVMRPERLRLVMCVRAVRLAGSDMDIVNSWFDNVGGADIGWLPGGAGVRRSGADSVLFSRCLRVWGRSMRYMVFDDA